VQLFVKLSVFPSILNVCLIDNPLDILCIILLCDLDVKFRQVCDPEKAPAGCTRVPRDEDVLSVDDFAKHVSLCVVQ